MTEFFKGATKFAGKAALATAGLAIATAAIGASSANAASFNLTVDGNSEAGATYILSGAADASDSFDFTAVGQVAANDVGLAFANATGDGVTGTNTGGNVPVGSGSFLAASLLVSANGTDFFSLFAAPSNVTSGNSTTVSRSTTIGDIFGSGLAANTTLTFKVADLAGNYADNLGSYNFSASTAAAVPEPFTVIGTLIGGTAAARMRKKLNSSK